MVQKYINYPNSYYKKTLYYENLVKAVCPFVFFTFLNFISSLFPSSRNFRIFAGKTIGDAHHFLFHPFRNAGRLSFTEYPFCEIYRQVFECDYPIAVVFSGDIGRRQRGNRLSFYTYRARCPDTDHRRNPGKPVVRPVGIWTIFQKEQQYEMKQSIIYMGVFGLGVAMALSGLLPDVLQNDAISRWILYLLLLFVGIQIGSGKNMFSAVKRSGFRIVLVPIATTLGTFAGIAFVSLLIPGRTLTECLSVGAGFAYYSLSSVLISEYHGAELGTVALLANIMREFTVLVAAPWLVKYFGKLAPVCAGGATTMDTTLPVITKFSGTEYVVIALFHGMILDFSVPLWVVFFLSF